MTWRRFLVLMGGLSGESLWAHINTRKPGDKQKRVLTDPAAAEAYFAAIK